MHTHPNSHPRWRRLVTIGGCAALLLALAATPGGATAPEDEGGERAVRATWWSYRPLVRPEVPAVGDASWVRTPVDAFILARLEALGLQPAPPADRVALIRRAAYDLTGLPPTPEQVDAFVADEAPDAWERLIDRLLASPHYGEKWGRHWLDLVRFGETDSYERDRPKPSAWKYRDYVIDSFNADKPYDRFLLEQLAGDELDEVTLETMIATGYYRLGIWDDEPTDVLQAQYDDLDSILATTAQVMLGMTVNCARCHEHKADPIPQEDYYRLLAFFENIKPYKAGGGNATTPANYVKSVPVDLGSDRYAQTLAAYEDRSADLARQLDDIQRRAVAGLDPERRAAASAGVDRGLVAHLGFDDADAVAAVAPENAAIELHGEPAFVGSGRHGGAIELDGRDDYVRLARPVQDDFTIALWFRTEATGPGGRDYRWFTGAGLVDGEIRGIVRDFGVSYHSDGRITAGTGAPETFLHSPPGYNDGDWHHVAFTRDSASGRLRLLLDGELVAEATGTTEPLDAPEFLDIGRIMPGYNHYAGAIDDVRIYDRVLADREVLALWGGSTLAPGFAPLVVETLGEEDARRFEALIAERLALKRPVRDSTEVLCVQERGATPPGSWVRVRGNAGVKGDPVVPGFPAVLGGADAEEPAAADDAESCGRRRTLAAWITRPDNIRSARVMANRIWQHHFGRGLVRTPNDFGRLGEKPTHPQLLDWLAVELVAGEWRLKRMHRLIMTSNAYLMSARFSEEAFAADPRNDLFWRFDMRRLSAEELRDSILAVNGTLNPKMGGPGVYPPMPEEVLATSSRPTEAWGKSPPEEAARRSVYIHVKRSLLTPLMVIHDLADTDSSCPVRFSTTQPTQALTMLNSAFINEQAVLLAGRLRRDAGADRAAQVARAVRLACGRRAEADEIERGVRFIDELEADFGLAGDDALARYCLLVLNLNEFVYLD